MKWEEIKARDLKVGDIYNGGEVTGVSIQTLSGRIKVVTANLWHDYLDAKDKILAGIRED